MPADRPLIHARHLLLVLLVVAGSLPLAPAGADARWRGQPTLISGTWRLDRGEWIYTDFVYDDYGADTGPAWGQPNVVSLAPTAGDARYPDGEAYSDNTADMVEVRLRAVHDDLQLRVLLQTITDPATPAIWVRAGEVSGVFTNANADIDVDANTVTFTIPRAAGGDTIELNVGAGLNDGEGGLRAGVPGNTAVSPDELTTGGPTENRLLDLAFNTLEIEPRGGAWNEAAQSAALASGDLEPFAQRIDVGDLRARATTPIPVVRGYSVRLFPSRQGLGEGVAEDFPQYRGRWQPYAVWVPGGYDPSEPAPLFLSMHSLSVHHNQYRGGTNATYRTYYEQFGDTLNAVVVTPLARGPDGWYQDEGLIDTLEVWADAVRRYTIDRDRVWVGGYSMGGYGTYRLATMMPDSFASAVSVVGPPGNGIWAYPGPPPGGEDSPDWTYPQLENTMHVPFWVTQGAADELVPVAGVKRQTDRLAELGHEYRFALHPAADHFSFAAQDDWTRETAWLEQHAVRTDRPAEVTFKLRPASWASDGDPVIVEHLRELGAEVGANIDGAYWVEDVEVAGDGDVTGFVDLTSHGIRRRRAGTTPINTAGTDGPSPHLLTGIEVAYGEGAVADELTGRLSNVSALTIDVGRAGLSNSPGLDIEADREVTITFVRRGAVVRRVTVGGAEAAEHSVEHATVTNPDDGTEIAITIFKPAAATDRDVPVVFHSHG
jgi:predicted esterase